MFDSVHNTMYVLCMLPDKSSNARVLGDEFVRTVRLLISCRHAFDKKIVNKDIGLVGDLILENEDNAVLKFSRGIRKSLGQDSKA